MTLVNLPYSTVPAESVVPSTPVQMFAKFVMFEDCAASTVSSVACMAKKSPVTAPVPLMYCPPLSPKPLYSVP